VVEEILEMNNSIAMQDALVDLLVHATFELARSRNKNKVEACNMLFTQKADSPDSSGLPVLGSEFL
jgi:hypothetical protein